MKNMDYCAYQNIVYNSFKYVMHAQIIEYK